MRAKALFCLVYLINDDENEALNTTNDNIKFVLKVDLQLSYYFLKIRRDLKPLSFYLTLQIMTWTLLSLSVGHLTVFFYKKNGK